MKAGMRTLLGISPRSREMRRLLNARTTSVVSPIPRPFMAEVVTASVGHMPSISTKVGFSFTIPLYNLSPALFMAPSSLPAFADTDSLD